MVLRKNYNLLLTIIYFICFFSPSASAEALESKAVASPPPRAVLGINIADGQETGGPVEGVTIFGVTPGGAADEAGLQTGDILVEINDVSLMAASGHEANRKLLDFMTGVSPGDDLKVVYLRDGRAGRATLTAEALDTDLIDEPGLPFMQDLERLGKQFGDEFIEPFRYRWRHHGLFAGMELVTVTPELGRYFGTDYGLLVVRAPDNKEIDLQDGDVIREIGGRRPKDPDHAMRILRSYEAGEEVIISIMRDQRDTDIAVMMPDDAADAAPDS